MWGRERGREGGREEDKENKVKYLLGNIAVVCGVYLCGVLSMKVSSRNQLVSISKHHLTTTQSFTLNQSFHTY